MKKIKIFLASSSELKPEREEFEIFIYRECKNRFIDQGIFLHLELWEDFKDSIVLDGLQSSYNQAIQECNIFVLLAWNKMGKYTNEEFESAYQALVQNKNIAVYTYLKPPSSHDRDDLQSLWRFKDKLKELKHYPTEFVNSAELLKKFREQLDKLLKEDFQNLLGLDETAHSKNLTASNDNRKIYNIQSIDQAGFS